LNWIYAGVGSHLTKNFSDIDLMGKGAEVRMSAFYFANGEQHLDHDTQQNHLAPHTTSDLLFKGALLDRSRSVWQGMIYVAPGAQITDGYQANRNLLLSENARADSIPGLEILADDVRCTHGATVGQLEAEPIFYLMSRGLPRDVAERLVIDGFFTPIMERIPFERVRQRFKEMIDEKLNGDSLLA
jgi:Fe-S cluster assembly protein SufD